METRNHYSAFISYRHLENDQRAAEQLQSLLENYRQPKGVANGKRIGRIFRDTSELPASRDLDRALEEALLDSDYLILILSEKTKDSKWCMEELRRFKEAHGGSIREVLPVLVSGEPEEVFPEELRCEERTVSEPSGGERRVIVEVEPVCADIRAGSAREQKKRLRTEFLRLAAPMLGVGFDDLYRRQYRRRRRLTAWILSGCFALLLLLLGVIGTAYLRVSSSERQIFRQMVLGHVEAGLHASSAGDGEEAMAYFAKALSEDPENKMAQVGALVQLQRQAWLYEIGETEEEKKDPVMPPAFLAENMTMISWPETGHGVFAFAGENTVCVWLSETDAYYALARVSQEYRSDPGRLRAAAIMTEDSATIVLQEGKYAAFFWGDGDPKKAGFHTCTLSHVYDLEKEDLFNNRADVFLPGYPYAAEELAFLENGCKPGLPKADMELGPCRPGIWSCPGAGFVVRYFDTVMALTPKNGVWDSRKTFSSYVQDIALSPAFEGYAVVTASRWSRGTRGNIVSAFSNYGILRGESAEEPRFAYRSLCFDNTGNYLLWADTGVLQMLNSNELGTAAAPLYIHDIESASVTQEDQILLKTKEKTLLYDAVGFRCDTEQTYTQKMLAVDLERRPDLRGYTPPREYSEDGEIVSACSFDGGFAVLVPGNVVLIYLDGQTEPAAVVELEHGDNVANGLAVSPEGWLCAVSFSQTVSNLEEGKKSFWAVEIWNWKENRCLADLGNRLRYGTDQVFAPRFPEPNLLCYCENNKVRTILLDAETPDEETVAALQELAGIRLDDSQTLQKTAPHFPGRLGNWEQYVHSFKPLAKAAGNQD